MGAVIFNYISTSRLSFKHFQFSDKNYYLLTSVFVFSVIADAAVTHSWFLVLEFFIFAIAGVVGETLFSIWWHSLYSARFWTYQVETVLHSYTSLLNFIPWGAGGMLYMSLVKHTNFKLPGNFILIFSSSILLMFLFQIAFFKFGYRRLFNETRFHQLTFSNYIFFCLPILFAIIVSAVFFGPMVLVITLWFGAIAGVVEYLFGKCVEFFISKKLWTYN